MIDGTHGPKEEELLENFIRSSRLEDSEKTEVKKLYHQKTDPYNYIDLISEPSHLAQLHHLADILFQTDDFNIKEIVFLEKFTKYIEKKIDPMAAMRKIEDHLKDDELKRDEDFNQAKGLFLTLVELFKKNF